MNIIKRLFTSIEGILRYLCEEYTIGGVRRTELSLTISEGIIKGEIHGSLEGEEFCGYCDEDGLPDGEWSLTFKERNAVSDIEKEMWNHGKLVKAYHEDMYCKKMSPKNPQFVNRINYIIDNDVSRLIRIVGRGTVRTVQCIPFDSSKL